MQWWTVILVAVHNVTYKGVMGGEVVVSTVMFAYPNLCTDAQGQVTVFTQFS